MPRHWRDWVKDLPQDCDILVLAGDITSYSGPPLADCLRAFCRHFRRVVFVPGNHEYYGGSPLIFDALVKPACLDACGDALSWLDCSEAFVDGVRFLGATLWFPRAENDDGAWALNDFRLIADLVPWIYAQNRAAVEYLSENVRAGDVLVTHHLPTHRSVHPKYVGSLLNKFFVGDVGEAPFAAGPALWVHGHTHESVDYQRGPTRVVCNPYGYDGHEVNPSFDPGKTVSV